VRKLCPECKTEEPFDPKLYPRQFKPYRQLTHHHVAKGCENCHYTGYKGRKAVYEVIPIDAELASMIKNSIFDVSEQLKERGIGTLAENVFELFAKGETTLEEIYPLLFNY
jgi:general secretion pathway protein E/type IV pilus assembly protein PilB